MVYQRTIRHRLAKLVAEQTSTRSGRREVTQSQPCPVCGSIHYEEDRIGAIITGWSPCRVQYYVQASADRARIAYRDGQPFHKAYQAHRSRVPWLRGSSEGTDFEEFTTRLLSTEWSNLASRQIWEELNLRDSSFKKWITGRKEAALHASLKNMENRQLLRYKSGSQNPSSGTGKNREVEEKKAGSLQKVKSVIDY